MQNLTTLKTVLFAALLTVPALSASAQCPGGGACPQAVEDCACPQVKTIETRQPGGCIQAASKNGDCGEAKPVAYTLAPRSDEFKMSARQQLFSESAEEKEDRDGSIFGGGPCVSCDKNGSIFGGGPCKTCDKNGSIFGGAPCNGPACRPEKTNPKYIQNYILYDDSLYSAIHRQCGDFAPLELEWVDFRLKNGMDNNGYSRKLGKYRFRIFGCRRDTKNAILNEGRILEKDMSFIEIFDDMVSDCYKVVKTPNDLCLRADSPLPEYVLTAEITDYYMNLCDEYNWDEAKKEDKRIGSSEMTVVWRLMDLTKTNVLWKGKSVGYGEVEDGEYNGEIVLIERAFADAVDNLRNLPGFEDQLSKRLSPEELQRQRNALIDMQRQMDPVKCQFSEEIKVMEDSGSVSSGYGMNEGWINVPEAKMVDGQVVENSGSASSGFGAAESGNVTELQMVDGQIVENSGSVSSGSGAAEGSNVTELQLIDGQIVETSGASASGYGMAEGGNVTEIITTGGVVAEDSGVVSDGAAMYEVEAVEPLPSDMSAMIESDSLCIREQPDYDNMGPENVYKVRTAVVSVANAKGKKGAGLLISEQFVMTSADLVDRSNNSYALETINGKKLKARAFRINPKKNTALLVLDKPTQYTPLSLNLELPAVNKDNFMTLGLLNFTEGEGEGYLETGGKVSGYRYDEDGTSQIVIDTFVQSATIGGVLIDEKGRITGMAHTSRPIKDGPDLFLPIETAMKSLGVGICGKEFPQPKPKPQKSWRQKSVAPLIENTVQKAPEAMDVKERK